MDVTRDRFGRIMVTASNPKASAYGSASQCGRRLHRRNGAAKRNEGTHPASLARVRGNERTAKRRLSESKLKFCEALAPTIPWASQRSKTNFQRKTARAVFVSRARQCERAKERRLDTVSWRNQPPADAGFTLPLPGNGDLGLLRR